MKIFPLLRDAQPDQAAHRVLAACCERAVDLKMQELFERERRIRLAAAFLIGKPFADCFPKFRRMGRLI